MAASDAKFVPVKNAAFRVTFPILDGAGNSVTGAAGLDSEVSIDQGTFTDCTNEATEVATSSGVYYLDLTSSEMNGDTIAVQVKTTTTGAKTAFLVLYTAARSVNDLAYPTTSGRSIDVAATGEVGVDFSNVNGTLDAAEIGSGAITAAKFAAGAIDAAAIADGAIDSATFASGAINAAAIASDAITAAKIADGAIDAATFASGAINAAAIATDAITAAKIAADAIGASELAADAVTEIQTGLATSSALATVQADTDDIQTRLPSALVGGKMDSHVNDIANNAITAASIATDAITAAKIAADAIGASELAADAVTEIAAGISVPSAASVADAVWDEVRTDHTTSGTFGQGVASVQGNVTGSAASVSGAVGSVTGNVGGNVVGSTASVTAAVTVGTNNDKTGYTLSNAGIDAVLDRGISEPSGIFSWPASLRTIIGWLGVVNRNKKLQTSTTTSYRNDADSATLATRTVSDDGTTYTAGETT